LETQPNISTNNNLKETLHAGVTEVFNFFFFVRNNRAEILLVIFISVLFPTTIRMNTENNQV